MKIYECPKNCHINDRGGRCPRCGTWMLSRGSASREQVIEETKQRQREAWKNLNGRDFERIETSQMRYLKYKLDQEEIRHNRQKR